MMRINKQNILRYADAYDQRYACIDDEKVEIEMKALLRNQRYLKKEELKRIVGWKTRNRSVHWCEENKPDKVIKITKHSFCVVDEKDRIESLQGRKGGLN
jgi:Holliday junction resolvase